MISAVPIQNSILMGGYGLGQNYAILYAPDQRLTSIFVGGCTGGVLQSFLISPVERIKVLQQCNPSERSLVVGKYVVERILQAAAWRGLGATLLRDGIPHGVWFVTYDVSKSALGESLETDSAAVPLLSGAVAATVAWGLGYPADLIKTRQQSGSGDLGIIQTGRVLIQEANGRVIQGLYRGFGLKLVRAVPASMIGFSVYEFVKKQLVSR
jgi:solute carrier family 25 (mitochondrial carnitine/acylcarnitine transporter), member 20/29